jgi:hypothetical protein
VTTGSTDAVSLVCCHSSDVSLLPWVACTPCRECGLTYETFYLQGILI